MTEYAVLISADETAWANATEEDRTATFARHMKFTEMLAERGHKMTGGAELTNTATAKTVRLVDGSVSVTDGPYAETAEQLGGFYTVETDNLDDLLDAVGFLAGPIDTLEVRACVDHSGA